MKKYKIDVLKAKRVMNAACCSCEVDSRTCMLKCSILAAVIADSDVITQDE